MRVFSFNAGSKHIVLKKFARVGDILYVCHSVQYQNNSAQHFSSEYTCLFKFLIWNILPCIIIA